MAYDWGNPTSSMDITTDGDKIEAPKIYWGKKELK